MVFKHGVPFSPAEISDQFTAVSQVHRAIQLNTMQLLSSCVDKPSPNIAHLLLGFETGSGKHVSETTLQDPGEYVCSVQFRNLRNLENMLHINEA